MSQPVRQYSFSSGEIAPFLYARTDINRYESGLRTCRNMVPMRHGGVTGRPGTMFIAAALNNGNPVRLIPFIFNETGLGQSYVLEFGNAYIAFYQNGGVVVSSGHPYTIASPYQQADLATLQFDQCADIVTITHQSYAPMELKRHGATNWSLGVIGTGSPISGPAISGITGTGGGGSILLGYAVTSVNSAGEESDTGTMVESTQTLQAPSTSTPVTIAFGTVAGAVYYNIYRDFNPSNPGNQLGFVGSSVSTSFVDTGIVPDFTNQPPLPNSPFVGAGNYPSTIGFVQQRRAFANTINNPLGFWESVPGDFYNFDVHVNTVDSDAIIAQIAGTEVNAIQHIVELKFMLILSAGAEIYVQGNGNGVVTPSMINASTQSQYGASGLKPIKAGDILIFNQALGSKVRDFAFDFAIDGYRGNDISIFASHLFEGYTLVDWCYQKEPDSIIWAVRSDGTLLSCTYVREQQVLAWAHHNFTNGFVENVCAIPENGEYSLYLSVRRVINGTTVRYIERMSSRIWTDEINATYLDCFAEYNGINSTSETMTLTASGGFQTGAAAYQQSLTLTCSSSVFNSYVVGDQVFFEDAAYIANNGGSGNLLKLTIQQITNGTTVVVTPSVPVIAEFQNMPITTWAHAVQSLSGLEYLVGQKVSVWADRYVVGSPLNSTNSSLQSYTILPGGTLTLDKPYSVIYVGLPMIQDVQTLDLETYFGETLLAKRKRVATVRAYLYNTRSFFAGSENPDTNLQNALSDPLFQLFQERHGSGQTNYDQPPELFTDQDYVITTGRWNKNGRVFMRNVDPTPWTLLAISPAEEESSTQPVPAYAKRV